VGGSGSGPRESVTEEGFCLGRSCLGSCRRLDRAGAAWELGFCCSGGRGVGSSVANGTERNGWCGVWCGQALAGWLGDTWRAVIGGGAVDKAKQSGG
jgi:hypothetical protein